MYTHPYTEYVNHILNKSPSKAAYSFTKAERFRPLNSQQTVQQPYFQANGFQYRDGSKKYAYLHNQNAKDNRSKTKKKKQDGSPHLLKSQYYEQNKRSDGENKKNGGFSKSKSKSPLRPATGNSKPVQNHKYSEHKQVSKNQEFAQKYPPSQAKAGRQGKGSQSKSPQRKKSNKSPNSPSKTLTQELHQSDHMSKNITAHGYYPTGYELSPKGKYPISKVRDTPGYKFGKSSPGLRYNYMVKSQDTLGPGYYKDFSEFGPIKK